jgi:hypothetical protein
MPAGCDSPRGRDGRGRSYAPRLSRSALTRTPAGTLPPRWGRLRAGAIWQHAWFLSRRLEVRILRPQQHADEAQPVVRPPCKRKTASSSLAVGSKPRRTRPGSPTVEAAGLDPVKCAFESRSGYASTSRRSSEGEHRPVTAGRGLRVPSLAPTEGWPRGLWHLPAKEERATAAGSNPASSAIPSRPKW